MTQELIDKIKHYHWLIYSDNIIVDYSYGTSLSWEFANIYNAVPRFFNYSSSSERDCQIYELAHKENYDAEKSYLKIKKFLGGNCVQYNDTLFTSDGIITTDNIILKTPQLPDWIKDNLVVYKEEYHFLYASVGSNGFTTRSFPIKTVQDDILDNYNDDLPVDKYDEFIESKGSGIAILHGDPGAGKSYFIRRLIAKFPDKSFIWFDQSLLTQATSDTFVQFILSHKNSILIMEDCEDLLKSRTTNHNGLLNTVLNIADGIVGDSLDIKFICTFNTHLSNIDTAALRKGRLKIKYEFKKLTKDKVKFLFDKFGIKDEPKEMSLCDVYNYEEVTGGETKSKKIGF